MGREARRLCSIDAASAEVKALFESQEIILRGAIRRRYRLAAISEMRAEGEDLAFEANAERVRLTLGSDEAAKWMAAFRKGPPSLAAKLGLGGDLRAWTIGDVDEPTLSGALEGCTAASPTAAAIVIAVVDGPSALGRVLVEYREDLAGKPLWIVYAKGRSAVFGEGPVRNAMRAAGFIDTKVSAVSDTLSATRFALRQAG